MSPRHTLRRWLARHQPRADSRWTRWLGHRLHDPELWHLGRRTVAGGVGLGFFLAFIPLPVQMVLAAPFALLLRVNLPVTLVAIWLTNPLTMGPIYLFAFKVGSWITGEGSAISELDLELSSSSMGALFDEIWWPLAVGCLVCGTAAAAIGNTGVRWLWRFHLLARRRQRRLRSPPPGP